MISFLDATGRTFRRSQSSVHRIIAAAIDAASGTITHGAVMMAPDDIDHEVVVQYHCARNTDAINA